MKCRVVVYFAFLLLFLSLVLALAGCGRQPAAKDPARLEAAIDKLMREMDCPGVLFSVDQPGRDEVLIAKGYSDLEAKRPISADNVFRIGSVTKTFTSTVLLQLAGEGKISLDDPVGKYRPEVPNGDRITVRMLLNHTSGIFSYTEDEAFVKAIETDPLRSWTPDELVSIGLCHDPYFAPGSAFDYSNTAYILAGDIIEQVTGRKYEEEIRERIISRLRLQHTILPSGVEMPGNWAHGYTYDLGGGLKDISRQQTPTWGWAAGGLVSDLADLKKCARAFGTGELLTGSARDEFFTWTPMPTKPGTPASAFSGLGVGKVFDWVGNTGGTYGYTTWMWYLPERDATVIAFFNQTSTFTPERETEEQAALQELLLAAVEAI